MSGLKKSLGTVMLTFYGLGMILGAGIYSVIGKAAGISGESLWLGFIFAACTALLTALSYAELATMYPKAGGEFIYLEKAFPERKWLSVIVGLMMTFAGCATASTVAIAFANYLQHFIEFSLFLSALFLLLFFACVNIAGIQESSWFNAIFTLIEMSGLGLFIYLGATSETFGEALSATPSSATLTSASLIIFAYFGFENIVNLAEEAKEPSKSIPRAIILSLLISTALYILVSLAALALMSPEALAQTDSALTTASQEKSPKIANILGAIALFSTANTALIAMVTTSRIFYGMAKAKSIPTIFTKVLTKRKSPWVAALLTLGIAAILLPLGKIEVVASVSSFATLIAFFAVNISLIVLRLQKPNEKRPFKVPLAIGKIPVLPVLGIIAVAVFIFQFETQVYAIGFAALALAGVFHYFYSRKTSGSG